jgi:predicted nucleotidyltransferase
MKEHIEKIKNITGLKNISDIFLYGSRTYNTYQKNSDYDFIVLSKDRRKNGEQYNHLIYNITVYTPTHFQEKLNENKPFAIECFKLPEEFKILNNTKFNLKLKDFENEYLMKIEEDKKKLLKDLNLYKRVKVLLFIKKLEMQLESLKNNKEFRFDLKEEFNQIKENEFNTYNCLDC